MQIVARLVLPLVLSLSLLGAYGCSSGQLAPEVAQAIGVADCQLEAVRALVPHVETADAVGAAARAGDSRGAIALLLQLGMQRKEIEAVADAFAACLPGNELVQPQGSDS